ncbi:MAG TPA: hypothetical protein VNS63_13320 [Blastocatellia bacterium]|nr:hypothetical protein [Blastocatellia bacterium]
MERDREIRKLVNVLRRIVRAANYASWRQAEPDAARFCVSQYNKVLSRLAQLEPAAAPLFTPLAETASPEITRMAAYELAAYFEDEAATERGHRRARHCGGRRVRVGWTAVVR